MGSVTGWSQNTLLSQGCILETALTMGTVVRHGDGDGQRGGERQGSGEGQDSHRPSPALVLTGNHILLMCSFLHLAP